jgi:hypothetical protein
MTDEDETTSSSFIVAAERTILKFLRDREARPPRKIAQRPLSTK